MILGIDEVGRGSWAGPLVVGAVVLGGVVIDRLTDSKKLTKKQREKLDKEIREKADCFGLGWVESEIIDEIGLSNALKLATKLAIGQITAPYHEIIIDGTVNFLSNTNKGKYVTTMKKADLLVPCVSAASIIAKVARDNFMTEQDRTHPNYGFKSHVGYGTAAHAVAIEKFGVTPLHRLSFAPLAKYRDGVWSSRLPFAPKHLRPTTKQIGDSAEDVATSYLSEQGHKILDRNWKTKFCEIDIVSRYSDTIYFSEVKYRKKSDQGGGLAAITPKKLRQMKFAAEYYSLSNKFVDVNLRLAVVSVSGEPPAVNNFLEV